MHTERGSIRSSSPVPTTHGLRLMVPRHMIAASFGFRIGVPPSTPNTPTLVIVNVQMCIRDRGEVEPIDASAGHIPGAVNRPVTGFFTAAGTLPAAADLVAELDLPPGREVAVYCLSLIHI